MNADSFSFLQCTEENLKKFDIQVKDKKELITHITEHIFRKCAKTNKEKFELLDLRDKVLKLIRFEAGQLTNSVSITLNGTCGDMCPEKERYSREYLSLCHRYEMVADETNIPNQHLMIKEYSRSSADQDLPLPNEMRPLLVLYDTLMFIIDDVIAKIASVENDYEFSYGDWYDFVWNRTRSIRKEITQQRLLLNESSTNEPDSNDHYLVQHGLGGVILIEQCVRFHIFCAHRLCELSTNSFDTKINEENLKNCFQDLRHYYDTTSSKSGAESAALRPSPNEPEFRSYIILLHLNESNILSEIQRWPEHIRHSRHVKFALKVYFAYYSRNHIRFFRLVKSNECEYLQACILHRYFYKMRCEAFKSIFTAFRENKEKIYPMAKLVENLGFENEDEANEYCNSFSLDKDDDGNVIMRVNTSVETFFKLSKTNEDSLKFKRSYLLVERKFEAKLDASNNQLTAEECLSEIISGQSYLDGTKRPSRFEGGNYELKTSFNEEGYYSSNEINELLAESKEKVEAVAAKPKVNKVVKPQTASGKTSAANKSIVKRANSLVKKAAQQSTKAKQTDLSLVKERRKSSSSTSSTASETKLNKSPGDNEPDDGFQEVASTQPKPKQQADLIKRNQLFKPFADLKQAQAPPSTQNREKSLFGSKPPTFLASRLEPTQTSTKPAEIANPFLASNKQTFAGIVQKPAQPFQKPAEAPSLFGPPSGGQNLFSKPTENQNLFAKIVRQEPAQPAPPRQDLDSKEKMFDTLSENIFSNLCLEIVREKCGLFLFGEKQLANEILEQTMEASVKDLIRRTLNEEVNSSREQLARQQQMISSISEQIYNDILSSLIQENCKTYLKLQKELAFELYEEILLNLFQKEFEIIIKQIANELNNDLILEKLAENVYLNWSEDMSEEIKEIDTNLTLNSMYANDLHSYLHQCVYESTRLNLNVNREFYYEIKQALALNQQMYIFRKWRLKLSIKLLTIAHRRASLTSKKPQQQQTAELANKPSSAEISQQLNMISFMKSYGVFLRDNLSKTQKIIAYLIPNSYYSFDFEHLSATFNLNSDFNMIKLPDYSIVHCEPYQMYLTWNSSMNYKNYLYDLLLDNYFSIIRNKDNFLILPPPLYNQIDNAAFNNTEIFIKMVLAMPLSKQKAENDVKRWLVSKFFGLDNSDINEKNSAHLDSLCVNCLKSNKFGIRFCFRMSSSEMSPAEYQQKLNTRLLFGANSMVFVLMPVSSDLDSSNISDEEYDGLFREYLVKTRSSFNTILGLFNENLNFSRHPNLVNAYEFMFISYLDSNQQTKTAIDFILGSDEMDNYCYCLLDGDVLKDNGVLQRTYQFFLQKICLKYSKMNLMSQQLSGTSLLNPLRHEPINNISSLAEIFDMSCMKFIDFLCHHPIRNSICIPFDCVLKEFNVRLRKLVSLLTNEVYKSISWPMPEISDCEASSEMWTLKYWNTSECFENVIGRQFYNLLYLNEEVFEIDKQGQNELIEFNQIEISIFNYLNKLLTSKVNTGKFPAQAECIKSIYHLESTLKTVLENMRKLCNLSSLNTSKNLFKLCEKQLSADKLLIKKSSIEWSKLILPIIDYLLSNGFVVFQEKRIYLNQFYIYFNLNELKSFDWINNCVQPQLSPNSYAIHMNESAESNYLVKKYAKQMEEYSKSQVNLKRRYSGDSSLNNLDKTVEESTSEGSSTSKLESSNNSDSHIKQLKYQKLITSPLKTQLFEESSELETKLSTFLSMLNREKENADKFENRLNKLVTTEDDLKSKSEDEEVACKILNINNDLNSSESNKAISKDLDSFLEKLKQEKLKNEQFNSKLDKMLNY